MLRVVIDRRTWYRGKTAQNAYLLDGDTGEMCCMGFASLAAGLKPEQIRGKKSVNVLGLGDEDVPGLEYFTTSTETSSQVYATNDNPNLSDAEREDALIQLGKRCNIEFVFEN